MVVDIRKLIRESIYTDQFGDQREKVKNSFGWEVPKATFASDVKSMIVDIFMEAEGISEKNFTAVGHTIREVRWFFKKSEKARALLNDLEKERVRPRLAAETIYSKWHELDQFREDDGLVDQLYGLRDDQGNIVQRLNESREIKQYSTQEFEPHGKERWEPLYTFLRGIFAEGFMDAAKGFMFMIARKLMNGPYAGLSLFWYKHGITRKYVVLDVNGNPYDLEMVGENFDEIRGLEPEYHQVAYHNIYSDLENFLSSGGSKEGLTSGILTDYNKYKEWRDNFMHGRGLMSRTISRHDLNEARSKEQKLKDDKVKLTDEERAEVIAKGATWDDGLPGVWKSKDKNGNVQYCSNTHRAMAVSPTLTGAIKKFEFIKSTS